jgi:uncharacterized membrane protein SpoIIM required for sporulation
MLALALTAAVIGFFVAYDLSSTGIPSQLRVLDNPSERIQMLLKEWPLFAGGPVLNIWWQNVRALLLGMVLGGISLGIFGVLPLFATMALLGGLVGILERVGVPVGLYIVGFILPHGWVEIPAAVLATAAVLQAGALQATPSPGKTVGEVWITSLAEWAKIMLGVVIPLLLVAAALEAWVTPRVAFLLFH